MLFHTLNFHKYNSFGGRKLFRISIPEILQEICALGKVAEYNERCSQHTSKISIVIAVLQTRKQRMGEVSLKAMRGVERVFLKDEKKDLLFIVKICGFVLKK